MCVLTLEIEDQENWHGKALGDKGKTAIKELKDLMSNSGFNGLGPQPVTANAPAVEIGEIKLSEPPSYTLEQKVRKLPCLHTLHGLIHRLKR